MSHNFSGLFFILLETDDHETYPGLSSNRVLHHEVTLSSPSWCISRALTGYFHMQRVDLQQGLFRLITRIHLPIAVLKGVFANTTLTRNRQSGPQFISTMYFEAALQGRLCEIAALHHPRD